MHVRNFFFSNVFSNTNVEFLVFDELEISYCDLLLLYCCFTSTVNI